MKIKPEHLAAAPAQAISQPGGFDAGDMASAAAQGYRDGWAAAQAISAEPAVAGYAELPDAKTLGEAVAAWIGVETRGAHNRVDTTVDRLGFAVRSVMGDMLRASHGQASSQEAESVPAIQGEMNVQLDIDSNHSAPGQQRGVARSVALGQPIGNGQDQAAGRPSAQGDKLLTIAERNIRSLLRSAQFKCESDREAALNCVDVLWAAARDPADSVPAVEREQERIAFKDAHRHLDLDEVSDAWGRPMFKHSHVEASWLGWIARASSGQAPAGAAPAPVLHLVHSAFAEVAMAFPKAFALHKVGIADTAVREALAAPATQQAGEVVAYLDVGAGGYLDLDAALSDEAMQQLPKGRHALVIAGTYGIDGYVAAPQPSPTTKPAPQQEAQEPALFVSAKQLADLVDPSHATGGSYLPARKTRAGLFTQPLYTAPQPAPAPLSEREVFEATWEKLHGKRPVLWSQMFAEHKMETPAHSQGKYFYKAEQAAWELWQARAALVAQGEK